MIVPVVVLIVPVVVLIVSIVRIVLVSGLSGGCPNYLAVVPFILIIAGLPVVLPVSCRCLVGDVLWLSY